MNKYIGKSTNGYNHGYVYSSRDLDIFYAFGNLFLNDFGKMPLHFQFFFRTLMKWLLQFFSHDATAMLHMEHFIVILLLDCSTTKFLSNLMRDWKALAKYVPGLYCWFETPLVSINIVPIRWHPILSCNIIVLASDPGPITHWVRYKMANIL